MVSGRFHVDIWPRHLMWAFEWCDVSTPITLKRGEPWWYVRFDHADPSRAVRMVAAEKTPEVTAYLQAIKGVTNYVNQTFSLMEVAKQWRPERLLQVKARPAAEVDGEGVVQTVLAEQMLAEEI